MRSGRTGRAGKKGTSISIIHTREKFKVRQIEKDTFTLGSVYGILDVAICHLAGFKADVSFF